MASAGMGDVLSGLIGSLIVQGSHYNLDPWKATCLAVLLENNFRLLRFGFHAHEFFSPSLNKIRSKQFLLGA